MPKSTTNVLHFIDGFGAGGAETWLFEAVKYLDNHPELGLHFDFVCTGGEKRLFDEQIIALGSQIYYIKFSFSNLRYYRRELKRVLKSNQYNVIHSHSDFITAWHLLPIYDLLPSKIVSHLHNPYNFVNNYTSSFRRKIAYLLGRILNYFIVDAITGTSNAVMDEYGYDKFPYRTKRVKPCYCGINTDKFLFQVSTRNAFRKQFGFSAENKVMLFVGRIGLHAYDVSVNQKNPEFAFEIAKKIIALDPNWKVLFVGIKGDLGDKLEASLYNLNLEGKIYFLGVRNDVAEIMSASDVLLFPSIWEGLGMVAVEAQLNGLPVVMSDSVPLEAVINSELVQMISLNSLSDKWIDACKSAVKSQENNRQNVRIDCPFTIESSVRGLKSLYSEIK